MSEEIDFSMASEGTGMGLSATDLSPLEGGGGAHFGLKYRCDT